MSEDIKEDEKILNSQDNSQDQEDKEETTNSGQGQNKESGEEQNKDVYEELKKKIADVIDSYREYIESAKKFDEMSKEIGVESGAFKKIIVKMGVDIKEEVLKTFNVNDKKATRVQSESEVIDIDTIKKVQRSQDGFSVEFEDGTRMKFRYASDLCRSLGINYGTSSPVAVLSRILKDRYEDVRIH